MGKSQPPTQAAVQAAYLEGMRVALASVEVGLHDLHIIRQDMPAIKRRAKHQKRGELNGLDLARQLLTHLRKELTRELERQQKESSRRDSLIEELRRGHREQAGDSVSG